MSDTDRVLRLLQAYHCNMTEAPRLAYPTHLNHRPERDWHPASGRGLHQFGSFGGEADMRRSRAAYRLAPAS
jgi:hypothetical protein